MSVSMNTKAMASSGKTNAPSVWMKLHRFFRLSRQRRHLGELDDHMLADIGVTREQALKESRKLAWDVPTNWRT